ncbi:MAG: phosphoenolpyruvate synthase, partial [Chroococcidiopsidaceae cyanobacterium CP_BM_RX_35]|nr:phosphoenolpyruvate synthase [Chroococcidiopsidaceae cyanobacterium CP_BM_RX_35]
MVKASAEQSSQSFKEQSLVLWFNEVGIADIPLVGGKNASLGEMIQQLAPQGVNVPMGFSTTAKAYRYFIQVSGLEQKLRSLFLDLNVADINNLRARGKQARSLMLNTPFPVELREAITTAYQELCARYGNGHFAQRGEPPHASGLSDTDVAVRSSATAEDLPDASFAGQQETYLNIHGIEGVLAACHRCFASLFTDRAISYRQSRGFDHLGVALSIGVQKMVRSDLAASGVMFSIDTESGFQNAALITAAYGLGENVVQGAVNPDEYLVFKPTLRSGFRPILTKRLGSKEFKLIYDSGGSKLTKNVPVPPRDRGKFALQDEDILQLGRWACLIEDHYSQVRGTYTPMDIEWAKDGMTGELFVVQARPETVQSQRTRNLLRSYHLQQQGKILAIGRSVGDAIGQGKATVILDANKLDQFREGEVLVTEKTDPDWEPILKKAGAIVTNQGGRTCHAAIIARELGIPAIVGCGNATTVLQAGQEVTVSCAEGEEGRVYAGLLPFEVKEVRLGNLPRTRTQIMMNVGKPAEAFSLAAIPNDGVGLTRSEFIIANHIQVHPLALIHFDQLKDEAAKAKIADLTALYENKCQYFVERLAHGVGTIAAAFYPNPVILRMSDFKSNEYANLLGGRQFEPQEENPMLGWRGASRYYDERYRDAYALECQALRQVREEMGLTNVIAMIPFCRTPDEGRRVLAEMAKHGLEQ